MDGKGIQRAQTDASRRESIEEEETCIFILSFICFISMLLFLLLATTEILRRKTV